MKLTRNIAATAAPTILLLAATIAQAGTPGTQVNGFLDGVKPGSECTSFVMGGTMYGVPSSKIAQSTGIVVAWANHQQMSFDVTTKTISCNIDGVNFSLPLAEDVTFGVLDVQ